MPHRLKIRAPGTDARAMSETALTPTNETPTSGPASMLLDGDAPRLGSTPLTAPSPMGAGVPVAPTSQRADVFGADTPAPALPATAAPSIPAPSLPTLPSAAPAIPSATASQLEDGTETPTTGSEHPMAHLMGGATKVSAASQRAAEIRAAKKAKAKKMKIGFVIGALVFAAVVGPPVWSWFTNALNETGTTNTEEPAD